MFTPNVICECDTCHRELVECMSDPEGLGEWAICRACWTRQKRNAARRAREEAMRSIGMTKVKGNLGGTYWE